MEGPPIYGNMETIIVVRLGETEVVGPRFFWIHVEFGV